MDHGPLPDLGAPFDQALKDALAYLDELPETVIGVWLAGSVARGEGDKNSDLDLYVLVDADHRRRLSRRFNGVPTEIFLNPPRRAREYFEEDRAMGRRPSLDMMAAGLILFDPNGECATIAREARAAAALGPNVDPVALETRRYLVADKLENAVDVAERDPVTARLLASTAIHEAIIVSFLQAGRWAPRDKDVLPELRILEPGAAALVDRFHETGDLAIAVSAVNALVGVSGFYEWETPPEPRSRPTARLFERSLAFAQASLGLGGVECE